jgi:hypothetical protein
LTSVECHFSIVQEDTYGLKESADKIANVREYLCIVQQDTYGLKESADSIVQQDTYGLKESADKIANEREYLCASTCANPQQYHHPSRTYILQQAACSMDMLAQVD